MKISGEGCRLADDSPFSELVMLWLECGVGVADAIAVDGGCDVGVGVGVGVGVAAVRRKDDQGSLTSASSAPGPWPESASSLGEEEKGCECECVRLQLAPRLVSCEQLQVQQSPDVVVGDVFGDVLLEEGIKKKEPEEKRVGAIEDECIHLDKVATSVRSSLVAPATPSPVTELGEGQCDWSTVSGVNDELTNCSSRVEVLVAVALALLLSIEMVLE